MHPFVVILFVFAALGCRTARPDNASRATTEPLTSAPAPVAAAPVAEPPCDWPGGDWPVFQRNPERNGLSDAPGIVSPRLRWSKSIGIAGWLNNPVIVNDHVFVGSAGQMWNQPDGSDGVTALDIADGEKRWFHATEGDVNGVAYSNCRVFATLDLGEVIALDARTGDRLWSFSTQKHKAYTNPLPVGSLLIFGDASGTLWALNARDGKFVWSNRLSGPIRGGAAFDGTRLIVTSQARETAALDPKNGNFLWVRKLDDPNAKEIYAAPTVVDGRVIVGYARDTSYETPALVAYDAANGDDLWTASNPRDLEGAWGNIRSSPAVVDGRLVYGEPYSNRVVTVDAENGEVTASVAAGTCMFPHWPSAAVAQGTYYVPRHDGGLYAFDATSGALRWQFYLGDATLPVLPFPDELADGWDRCAWEPGVGKPIFASPAIAADGTVLVATGDGYLHAVSPAVESSDE